MAYEIKPKDEELNPTLVGQNAPVQPIGAPIQKAGGTAANVGAAQTATTPSPQAQAAQPTPGAGAFQDINKYLAQNQPQTQALGAKVAGAVTGDINQAANQATGYQGALNTAIQAGVQQATPEQQNTFQQNLLTPASNTVAGQTPAYTPLTTDQQSQFKNLWNAQYRGPQDVGGGTNQDLNKQNAQALGSWQNAQQTAQQAGTAGGRTQLIARTARTPETAGQLAFNQSLLSNSAPAAGQIAQAAKGIAAPNATWEATNAQVNPNIAAAITAQQNAVNQFRSAFNPNQIENQASQQEQQNFQDYLSNQQALQDRVKGNPLNIALPKNVPGIMVPNGQNNQATYGVNAQDPRYWTNAGKGKEQFISGGEHPGYLGATQDQVARYNALNNLIGQGNMWNPTAAPAQGQAAFDQAQYLKDVAAATPAPAAPKPTTGCFAPDTLVKMSDGTDKEIQDIRLGDETMGGRVYSTMSRENDNITYNYAGIIVTAFHKVIEPDAIRCVKDSCISEEIKTIPYVYTYSCEQHRIYIGEHEFMDFDEDDEDRICR